MSYNVAMLTTTAECEQLVELSKIERVGLEYRISGLKQDQAESATAVLGLDEKLAVLNAEIYGYEARIADPATSSTEKSAIGPKLQSAYGRRSSLQKKEDENNAVSILKRINDIARAQRELEELETFITEVSARQTSL